MMRISEYKYEELKNLNERAKENAKEIREKKLDDEWYNKLPCTKCSLTKLCKRYNTFKRPDYDKEFFNLGEITCNMIITVDQPAINIVSGKTKDEMIIGVDEDSSWYTKPNQ